MPRPYNPKPEIEELKRKVSDLLKGLRDTARNQAGAEKSLFCKTARAAYRSETSRSSDPHGPALAPKFAIHLAIR
jgi:hypothetical protein